MDIYERAGYLNDLLTKHANLNNSTTNFPKNELFPKLTGSNKPPKLTNQSQVKINTDINEPPKLPNVNVTGVRPKFKPPMKTANPYNKTT